MLDVRGIGGGHEDGEGGMTTAAMEAELRMRAETPNTATK